VLEQDGSADITTVAASSIRATAPYVKANQDVCIALEEQLFRAKQKKQCDLLV
jgi:hypothetical protein